MRREYITLAAGLLFWMLDTDCTHCSIFLALFCAPSAWSMRPTIDCLLPVASLLCCRSCSVSTVGSDCFDAGSSRTLRPRKSGLPSGRGTCAHAPP
eukprot:353364-Chlamydomonas_euryale.AAC.12